MANTSLNQQIRYDSLDYLRGLMALAVLVFHYDKWLTGTFDAATLPGKLGVYAVSTFFVLSGLALTLAYENRLDDIPRGWWPYFKKRFWRIYPLLWLATAATLALDEVDRSWCVIFLNFTGLFGFVNPDLGIATGAWSIGCELVYYVAFPLLLVLGKKNRVIFGVIFAVLLAIGCWIGFSWFSPQHTAQSAWWADYVQVANHAFFFAGGMVIGVFRAELGRLPAWAWGLIGLAACIAFAAYPVGSEPFNLVSGINRIVFSTLTLVIVAATFRMGKLAYLHKPLAWLGMVSYSLYLLHPLVFRCLKAIYVKLGIAVDYWQMLLPALVLALAVSHFSYLFVERPFTRNR